MSLIKHKYFWTASGLERPIPVADWSSIRVCGRSLAKIVGSNPAGDMDVCLFNVGYCKVNISATERES